MYTIRTKYQAHVSTFSRPEVRVPLAASALVATGVLFSMAHVSDAGAQEATTVETLPASSGDVLEEITVTSRRREENLMRVPDSITAIGSDAIEERGLTEIGDFLRLAPNVKIVEEQDAATNSIFIRGIGSNKNQASAVAVVVDGVVLPDSDGFTTDLSDAESVEVLKGPQGALYGKGALAGAINVTTRQPTNEFEVSGKAGYGSGDTKSVFASVGGPLVPDTLLAQLSVRRVESDGVFRNEFLGRRLGNDEYTKTTLKLIATPGDAISLAFAASYYDQEAGGPPFATVDLLGQGGRITPEAADVPIEHDSLDISKRRITDFSLTAKYDAPIGTFTSTTAYQRIRFTFDEDLDFTALNIAKAIQQRNPQSWSQELRFTSPTEARLRAIVGLYYQNSKRELDTVVPLDLCYFGIIPCQTPAGTESGVLIPLHLADNETTDDQYAVFSQINYDLLDNLELTLALRYDRDEVEQVDALLNNRKDSTTFDDWQPKLSLAYHLSDDATVYTTYSHGYKSGAFNAFGTLSPNTELVVKQEGTDTIEIGTKLELADRRVRLAAAAFYTEYDNSQQYRLDIETGGQSTVNIARSELRGVELDVVARPFRGLDLNASFGYTDSEIKDFDGTSAYRGQKLPGTPEYTMNLGGEYTHSLTASRSVSARVDYFKYGETTFQDFQNPDPNQLLTQRSYDTTDARISFTNGAWTVAVYGRNLFDEDYVVNAYSRYISSLVFVPIGVDVINPAAGATYGGEVRFRF